MCFFLFETTGHHDLDMATSSPGQADSEEDLSVEEAGFGHQLWECDGQSKYERYVNHTFLSSLKGFL